MAIQRKPLVIFLGISLIFLLSLLIITFNTILGGVQRRCNWAIDLYKEDCVSSLMKVVEHKEFSFRERNDAIWALGQLADKRALLLLKSYYTGNIPSNEPYDSQISQYELKKAIRWCEHGNSTSWMYKRYR